MDGVINLSTRLERVAGQLPAALGEELNRPPHEAYNERRRAEIKSSVQSVLISARAIAAAAEEFLRQTAPPAPPAQHYHDHHPPGPNFLRPGDIIATVGTDERK